MSTYTIRFDGTGFKVKKDNGNWGEYLSANWHIDDARNNDTFIFELSGTSVTARANPQSRQLFSGGDTVDFSSSGTTKTVDTDTNTKPTSYHFHLKTPATLHGHIAEILGKITVTT